VKVLRNGSTKTLEVAVREMPGTERLAKNLGDSEEHALAFAGAILTTDLKRKAAAVEVEEAAVAEVPVEVAAELQDRQQRPTEVHP
jgi:N-acetylglutamate synthase/N-acetylornithine aminotransferase